MLTVCCLHQRATLLLLYNIYPLNIKRLQTQLSETGAAVTEILSDAECFTERRRMLDAAKRQVFEFRMLDWYYVADELKILGELEHGATPEELDTVFDDAFADYSRLDAIAAKGVAFSLVHVVSLPFTNYMELEAAHDAHIEEHGGRVYFIEKQKFFEMHTPEGVEIQDFFLADDTVLMIKHELDRTRRTDSLQGSKITDTARVGIYKEFSEALLRSSTPLRDFMADPRLKLRPEKIEQLCSTCGNNSAWVIYYGIRIGDEPPLIITKCTECGKTTRTGVG